MGGRNNVIGEMQMLNLKVERLCSLQMAEDTGNPSTSQENCSVSGCCTQTTCTWSGCYGNNSNPCC